MSLRVSGLKIKEGNEDNLMEIISLLKPLITSSMENRAKKELKDIYSSYIKLLAKDDNWKQDPLFDMGDFFERNVYLYVKKEAIPKVYFEGKMHRTYFPLLIKDIFSSEFLSYHKFTLKICPTKSSNKLLLILPFDFDEETLPKELMCYCDIYSASNSTDDIPSHFKDEKELEQAINDWYDIDDSNLFLSYDVNVDMNISEWIQDLKVGDFVRRYSVYEKVFKENYLEDGQEIEPFDMIEKIVELKSDKDFKELAEKEFLIYVQPFSEVHNQIVSELNVLFSNLKNKENE